MGEDLTFAIVGSCVTRDAFEVLEGRPWKLERYMARSHLGSFFGPATREIQPDYSPMTSAFQQRTVQDDVEKRSVSFLRNGDYDVLIYDPIDDRYPIGRFADGGLVTVSQEFLLLDIDPSSYAQCAFLTDEHWEHWERGWTELVRTLGEAERIDRLVYHDARWARTVSGLWGRGAGADRRAVRRANDWLARALERAREDLPDDQVVSVAPELVRADGDHKWGLSPYHYVPAYYQALLDGLAGTAPVHGPKST